MKILLDENIDVRFKNLFDTKMHSVFTVKDMNWPDGFRIYIFRFSITSFLPKFTPMFF